MVRNALVCSCVLADILRGCPTPIASAYIYIIVIWPHNVLLHGDWLLGTYKTYRAT